jgi:hypothetical protein
MSYNARAKSEHMHACFEESTRRNAAVLRRCSLTAIALAIIHFCITCPQLAAQSATPTELPDRIRGVVINSVTHEPISRALVLSPDNSFAAMTDDRGRFEFTFSPAETQQSRTLGTVTDGFQLNRGFQPAASNRPNALMARKVGFLSPDIPLNISDISSTQQVLTISLVPEARVVGHVILPGSNGSNQMQVSLYRRNVRDGHEHWDMTANATTRGDGEFRLAELPSGSYKLLTLEQLDRDPLTFDPRGQLFGYPPLYYPSASDFDTAAIIHLAPGETFRPTLSPTKRPYYPVNLGFATPLATPQIRINVWPQAHPGPGYSLGYNTRDGAIEGLLPDGTFTLQAISYGPDRMAGQLNFTVAGAPATGAALTLIPGTSITLDVREEFQHTQTGSSPEVLTRFSGISSIGGSPAVAPNPRRPNYFQITLVPDEQFGLSQPGFLRPPSGPDDESLVIENVLPGRYRVSVNTSIGYVASITSGSTDLLRQPLVVGVGGLASPLEITMRDDGAEVDGRIDSANVTSNPSTANNNSNQPLGFVCLAPMDRMDDRCKIAWTNPDGTFAFQQLAPGSYRAVAMDRSRPQLEALSSEILTQYESKIQVIRVAQEQKERVRLPLIAASE